MNVHSVHSFALHVSERIIVYQICYMSCHSVADNLVICDNVVRYVMLYPTSDIDQSATSVVSEMFMGYTIQLTYPSRAVWSI